jgi:hypothetical protein
MEQKILPEWVKKVADFLAIHKHVKVIYLNKNGEYHLHAVKGFEKVDVAEFMESVDTYIKPEAPEGPEGEETTEENTANNPGEHIVQF